jgi:glycerol-3-phosphate acyltransferase PlsY
MGYAIATVAGYLLGSILFAVILSRLFHGVDIRTRGSGNPGFTNVYRDLSARTGLLTLLGDILKGTAAVLLGQTVIAALFPQASRVGLGLAGAGGALIGHAFPLYHGFRGGKGVATGLGAFVSLAPAATGVAAVVWILTLLTVRIMSVASILAALTVPAVLTWILPPIEGGPALVAVAWIVALAIVLRHRSNLRKLRRGEERRFTLRRS